MMVALCATSTAAAEDQYVQEIKPVLQRYCQGCHNTKKHKGELSFEAYPDLTAVRTNHQVWLEVQRKLRTREMPPEEEEQPTEAERDLLAAWIDAELFPVDCNNPDPGRVTIRRLNRVEYANTIRDLTGISFNPAEDFPPDDTGYGFDNIGDALSMSPLLMERYLAAAEKIADAALGEPETRKRWLPGRAESGKANDYVRTMVRPFARAAFRRPVSNDEVERLSRVADNAISEGVALEDAIKIVFEAVLVSPHFLFRGELQPSPNNPQQTQPIDEYALASRLSYFLWSSMPDEELFALAEHRKLRNNLDAQVKRMLADAKSQAFVENFVGQWLQTRTLKVVAPDRRTFRGFDDGLRDAMAKETDLLFEHILREDRSILEFLTADYTFVNARLAKHYGIKNFDGAGGEFKRVSLQDVPRRGVLTHASVLTVTSNPTRTSPVKRGKWVLDNLLGQPPPPPPADVPPLSETREALTSATLRERTELHRSDPICASCHKEMDPIGFSLEHYNAIGVWREKDGTFPIDSSGRLKTGEAFADATSLLNVLASAKKAQFPHCLTEKLLTYALGRGLEYYDRCAVEKIASDLAKQDYRFSTLILGVIKSVPFQMRRGEGERKQS